MRSDSEKSAAVSGKGGKSRRYRWVVVAALASVLGAVAPADQGPVLAERLSGQPTVQKVSLPPSTIPPASVSSAPNLNDTISKPTKQTRLPQLTRPTQQTQSTRLVQSYGRLPLSFEENQGQIDSQVEFLARGRGYTLFLTPTEAVLSLRSAARPSRAASIANEASDATTQ